MHRDENIYFFYLNVDNVPVWFGLVVEPVDEQVDLDKHIVVYLHNTAKHFHFLGFFSFKTSYHTFMFNYNVTLPSPHKDFLELFACVPWEDSQLEDSAGQTRLAQIPPVIKIYIIIYYQL